ncbi:MAG: addiction module protein [Planctomycetes bacterium]|nr:addiction module protein [Planctomycetota bacterium]
MIERTKELLDEVLELPLSQRAALIAELAANLEAEEGPFDPEWLTEIERRAHDARRDRSGTTLDEVEARLAGRFPRVVSGA